MAKYRKKPIDADSTDVTSNPPCMPEGYAVGCVVENCELHPRYDHCFGCGGYHPVNYNCTEEQS